MSRAQKIVFAIFTIAIALTRLPALSLTLHDWDETLFASGVHEYDVIPHHPHPPGYPLFIALGKIARLFTDSDVHALQAVATIASMLVFPAAFLLARALKFRVSAAFAAAAMTAFLPTIWYYGGTALSDVPALVLILFGCALLLRGGKAYAAGALLTAAACCIRPHLLLIAIVPAILGRPKIKSAWIAAAALVAVAYAGAAYFSSPGYLKEVRAIQKHINETDSYHNPMRTPLSELAPRALLFPFGGGRIRYVILAFAAIALVRKESAILLAMFLPIAVFTWLMLDPTAFTRYAVAYVPLYAFLAVAGVETVTQRVKGQHLALIVITTFMTWSLIKWTWPALRLARTEPSPSVAVFQWVRQNVPREGPTVYVDNNLIYHAAYFIPDYHYQLVFDESKLNDADFAPGNVYILEGTTLQPDARLFTRKRLQLWQLTRPRYFEIALLPMHRMIRFERGWYDWEGDSGTHWRWMQGQSLTKLPPLVHDRGQLHIRLHAPIDVTKALPAISILWNGALVDRFRATKGDYDLRYVLTTRKDAPNELVLATDQTITPNDDPRILGLSLQELTWSEQTASP